MSLTDKRRIGVSLVFDKSFIHMINLDESMWVSVFFAPILVPIFYNEVLGGLRKKTSTKIGTPEDLVASHASKTPWISDPSMHHNDLVLLNLLGQEIEMKGRPFIAIPDVKNIDSHVGIDIKFFPELTAFSRWQKCEFSELEKILAESIKENSLEIDLPKWINISKTILLNKKFKNLEEIKDFVNKFILSHTLDDFILMLDLLDIPKECVPYLISRYKSNSLSLVEFAPYAAFVFKLKLFFVMGIYCSFFNEVSSYKYDIIYIFYLPFCNIFVSEDRSHSKIVPLFLEQGQSIITGSEFKKALSEINDYFIEKERNNEEIKVIPGVSTPPFNLINAVTILWDKHVPGWRDFSVKNQTGLKHFKELRQKLEKAESVIISRAQVLKDEEIKIMKIRRYLPQQIGRWDMKKLMCDL